MDKIYVEQIKAFLTNPLDSIEKTAFGGTMNVVAFRALPNTTEGMLLLHIDRAAGTFSVASSSTASTRLFLGMAEAYQRAAEMIEALGLAPAKG